MVKNRKFALFLNILFFVLFSISANLFQIFSTGDKLFNIVKSYSILISIVLYSIANLLLEKRPSYERWFGYFFGCILALNILETIIVALHVKTIFSYAYTLFATLLAISCLKLRWKTKADILGFDDEVWVLTYGICLGYLYLFMFDNGASIAALLILLITYIPKSRMGHKWFIYRAYSLGVYFHRRFTKTSYR